MKVALFVHCFFPAHFYGTETYTLELARNLRDLGHEPVVVTAVFPGEPPQPSLIDAYRHEGIEVIAVDKNRIPDTRVKDTYLQPLMAPVLHQILDRVEPDVLHVTHLINHTAALLDVAAQRRLPIVATFTDFFGFCYNNRLEAVDGSLCAGPANPAVNCLSCHLMAAAQSRCRTRRDRILATPAGARLGATLMAVEQRLPGRRRSARAGLVQDLFQRPGILRSLYANYDAAIAPTAFLREAYERNGVGSGMTTIRFGVDIDRRPKPPRPPDAPLTLGFIGQLAPHKGPDILIEAARRALAGVPYRVVIHGSEQQAPDYSARLREASEGAPVEFRGTFSPDKMRVVLDEMDFLVIPSRWYENSPLVLLNALASHTPVIVSDVLGMTEFVISGENGFVFARGSVDALAACLSGLAAAGARRHGMELTTHYDLSTQRMTEETIRVYERAISKAGRVSELSATASGA